MSSDREGRGFERSHVYWRRPGRCCVVQIKIGCSVLAETDSFPCSNTYAVHYTPSCRSALSEQFHAIPMYAISKQESVGACMMRCMAWGPMQGLCRSILTQCAVARYTRLHDPGPAAAKRARP